MILLDFVGQKDLRLRARGHLRHRGSGRKLRAAARTAGVAARLPGGRLRAAILDDHIPFIQQGVPSIDLIDFDFACFHRTCDDLSQISKRSLDARRRDHDGAAP